MESFKWGTNFETGIQEVDDQHRKLVELINSLGAQLAENDMADRHVEALLQELFNYTQYHFQEEERLMVHYGLDSRHCTQHLSAHKSFIDDVTYMSQQPKKGDGDDGKSLLEFLIHWLAYHILGCDKNMARQIAAINDGTSPSDVYLAEEKNVSESTGPLLAALNGLFQQVSRRNKELSLLNQNLETIVEERTSELVQANADLEILALTDVLTELPNRRHALLQLNHLWAEARQLSNHLACMIIDADGFKIINDSFGHDAGDVVLKRLALELRHSVRNDDIVCRMGGDEFLIICPNTPLEGALHIAELTRVNIARLRVPAGEGFWSGSISVGVAANGNGISSIDDLLKAADDGVYMAKNDGRNCVRTRQTTKH
ncbi:GGDEF domain-containing protein [Desulfopila sp. IMCC35008]|uniref:GGDEF domain-containing protein n=1 Tax=Desulfopila sp. IMCC35008 TaxID=2653858 RepID=UPI0013D31F83|nr:GGDEF domain-containing protein [Desulfopila sp. IMCC35008]